MKALKSSNNLDSVDYWASTPARCHAKSKIAFETKQESSETKVEVASETEQESL